MKILIADDHALFREGARHAVARLSDDVEPLEASNCAEALAAVDQHADVTLVLLDLHMPGQNGFVALETLVRRNPTLPIVVVSASDNRSDMRRALDSGAMGFIPKSVPTAVLLSALRLVLAGGIYVPPEMVEREPAMPSGVPLTARQLDVLARVIDGKPNKVIAQELGVSEATVKAHVGAVFKALNVTNRTQAVGAVQRLGIQLQGNKAAT